MSNILIINAFHPYPSTEGQLSSSLVKLANQELRAQGHETRTIQINQGWVVDEEIQNHKWADIVILQTPVYWMGVSWQFKKYMDEVYSAGCDGTFCLGDGRSSDEPSYNYGNGGTMRDKKYMLSLTFNAPAEAFDNKDEYLFQGKSIDDLFFPMHMNFRFFGMQKIESFACHDVVKNPDIENDFIRFRLHLREHFKELQRT